MIIYAKIEVLFGENLFSVGYGSDCFMNWNN